MRPARLDDFTPGHHDRRFNRFIGLLGKLGRRFNRLADDLGNLLSGFDDGFEPIAADQVVGNLLGNGKLTCFGHQVGQRIGCRFFSWLRCAALRVCLALLLKPRNQIARRQRGIHPVIRREVIARRCRTDHQGNALRVFRPHAAHRRFANLRENLEVTMRHAKIDIAGNCRPGFIDRNRLARLAFAVGLDGVAICFERLGHRR